jgi:hypothetical protein
LSHIAESIAWQFVTTLTKNSNNAYFPLSGVLSKVKDMKILSGDHVSPSVA